MQKFNYSKLIGKIAEKGYTLDQFASLIGISRTSLYKKLKGESNFTQDEIYKIVDLLCISMDEIPSYFFTKNV